MNTKILPLAVLVAAASCGVSAGEIYNSDALTLNVGGRMLANYNHTDKDGVDSNLTGSYVRLSMQALSPITSQLTAEGFYELQFQSVANEDNELDVRKTWVGLNYDAGKSQQKIYIGKDYGSLGLVSDYTDVFNIYGGDVIGHKVASDGRQQGELKYEANYKFGEDQSLTVRANYLDASTANGDTSGKGVAAKYAFGGFDVALGYADSKQPTNTERQDQVMGGLGYSTDFGLRVAGVYTDGTIKNADFSGFEILAAQSIDDLTVRVQYSDTETEANNAKTDKQSAIAGVQYQFTPIFRTWIEAKKELSQDKDNAFSVGARLSF